MTNGEKIRSMTDEELAKLFAEHIDCATCHLTNPKNCRTEESCNKAFWNWLKQQVEE